MFFSNLLNLFFVIFSKLTSAITCIFAAQFIIWFRLVTQRIPEMINIEVFEYRLHDCLQLLKY